MDAELAGLLESRGGALLTREPETTATVVARSVELKAGVVAEDERETTGRRAILNYGHTAAHALEAASGYTVLHGRAVAFGMRVAARVAADRGLCEMDLVATQDRFLQHFGLPGDLPPVSVDAILAALPRDKKSSGGRIRWVLPRELGRAEVGHEVPEGVVRDAVSKVAPS